MIHDKLSNEIWDYFNKLINVAYPIFSTFKGYVSLPRRTKLRPLAERKVNDFSFLQFIDLTEFTLKYPKWCNIDFLFYLVCDLT